MSDTPAYAGPATLAGVKLVPTIGDDVVEAELMPYLDGVNEFVRGLPVSETVVLDDVTHEPEDGWPYGIILGAQLLVARVWRRRNTPGGLEVFGDQGVAYVRRNDPDIATFLQLGDQALPSVG